MNLSFLKIRVADCPWILFDASAVALGTDGKTLQPDWAMIASIICARSRGASADGIIVADSDGQRISAWTRNGSPCNLTATASLCAARWLFDAGRAGSDAVVLGFDTQESEVLVIDSRNFGLAMGRPESPGGASLLEALGGLGLSVSVREGVGILIPLRIAGQAMDVVLYDKPPRVLGGALAGASRRRAPDSIEVLVVARHELRVRRGRFDPIVAAAAAMAAAVAADLADRELSVLSGGERLVAQWPEDGPIFVAAAPSYCLSGEFWADEMH